MTPIEEKIRAHAQDIGYRVRDISGEQMAEWVGGRYWMACCWNSQSIYIRTDHGMDDPAREFTILHEVGHAMLHDARLGKPSFVYEVPPVPAIQENASDATKQQAYLEEQRAWDRAEELVQTLDLSIPEDIQRARRGADLAKYREYFWPLGTITEPT